MSAAAECRHAVSKHRMSVALFAAVRSAIRFLSRHPRFALTAIATLALGIGANAAVFSVTNAVVFRQLPYPQAARLVAIREHSTAYDTPYQFMDLADNLTKRDDDFSVIGRSVPTAITISGPAAPERLDGQEVTANWFAAYGVRPALGRSFVVADEEAGTSHVVVLGYALWQRLFGGDPTVIGRSVDLSEQPVSILIPSALPLAPYTVVGVMPPHDRFPVEGDLWVPLVDKFNRVSMGETRVRHVVLVARLRPGITLERANGKLHAIGEQNALEFPKTDRGWDLFAADLRDVVVEDYRSAILFLFGSVTLLLALTCLSVGTLVIAKNLARRREAEIRIALGATSRDLLLQFLAEGLAIGVVGAAMGAWLARVGVAAVKVIAPPGIPRLDEVHVNLPVLGYLALVAIACGVLLGIAPALQLRSGGRRIRALGTRRTLVAAQLALVVPLNVGTALAVRGLERLTFAPLGFTPDRVLTFGMRPTRTVCRSAETCRQSSAEILDRLRAVPGVSSAALSAGSPFGMNLGDTLTPVGGSAPAHVAVRVVSPDYFRVLGIAIKSGRTFTDGDRSGAPLVAIANTSLAKSAFGSGAVGRAFTSVIGRGRQVEIVGEVADTRDATSAEGAPPLVYIPIAQLDIVFRPTVLLRTSVDAAVVAPGLRAAVAAVDPQAPVYDVATLDSLLSARLANPRFQTVLMGMFGALGLVLAVAGTYGLIASVMAQRRREFGVRAALGARPRDLLGMVVRESLWSVGAGVTAGTALGILAIRTTRALFFSVGRVDPITVVAAAATMGVVGIVAYGWPARQASRVNPMIVLRDE